QIFQDEIATPLGLDLYIRLPRWIPNSRLAWLAPPSLMQMLFGFPLRFWLETLNRRSNIVRALHGAELACDASTIYARNLEVPSGSGVGTARAIARAYSVFATDGRELGLRADTLNLLAAPALPPAFGFYDECMKSTAEYSLGFMKSSTTWPFGSRAAFGAPGAGGSLGFADPTIGLGYAYVTSQGSTALAGDPRDVALRRALRTACRNLGSRVADTQPAI